MDNLIPTILNEMMSDDENDSQALFNYYESCTWQERAIIENVMIYLTGWSMETILEKCGIETFHKLTVKK